LDPGAGFEVEGLDADSMFWHGGMVLGPTGRSKLEVAQLSPLAVCRL
jgi:hypothetical protein